MKFEIENVTVIYPEEETGVDRKIIIEDDYDCLQLDFIGSPEERSGGITLTKDQITILRDILNLVIKNKLVK